MENIRYNFLEEYNKLNTAQKKAVDTIDGAVLVVAGPGTGKTQILSARICNILKETDAKPENILCMTYTEAGVTAMRNRLFRFIGSDAYRVNIHTFHSFCNSVIQENNQYFSMKTLEPIGDIERIELFEKLIDNLADDNILKRWRGDTYYDIPYLQKLFSIMKTENISVADIERETKAYIEDLPNNPDFIYKRKSGKYNKGDVKQAKVDEVKAQFDRTIAAAKLYTVFEAMKANSSVYDFDDMIQWVLKAFQKNENLLLNYQERFQYVLVDEYQDTNGAQNEILKLLISYWENPNAFVVGDDDQSIYRFQGANLGNIINFYEEVICKAEPNVAKRKERVIVMTKNYRSTQAILDLAASNIQHNNERLINQLNDLNLSKDLVASLKELSHSKAKPHIIEYHNETQELIGVAQAIEKLNEQKVNLNEIAVIYKNHAQADALLHYLNQKKIAVKTVRKINVLEQALTLQLIDILSFVAGEMRIPHSREDLLFKMMHFPFMQMDTLQIARLSYKLREARYTEPKLHWREVIHRLDVINDSATVEKIEKLSKIIENWLKIVHEMPLQLFFQQIIDDLQLMPYIMQSNEKIWLLQELKTFFDFIKEENKRNAKLSIAELLETIATMEKYKLSLDFVRSTYAESAVNFTTAHSSKGLEFSYVFLIGVLKDKWDKKRADRGFKLPEGIVQTPSIESNLEENRRLFYVATTRAKEHLYISYSQSNDKGKATSGSQFIAEILEKTELELEKQQAKDNDVIDFTEKQLLLQKLESPELIEQKYIERFLENYTMSVTHLNNYLQCPLRFYYQHILQIPQAKNSAMAFGSAVHNAIEQLFNDMLKNDGIFPSEAEFIEITKRKMFGQEESFTSKEYQQRLDYICKFLPEYYQKYVNTWNKNIKNEQRIKAEYKGIMLTGYIDKMEFNQNAIDIIDYKTGQYNSPYTKKKFKTPVAEVDYKKPDEPTFEEKYGGNYWRQAVFYKILMEFNIKLDQQHWQYNSMSFDFVEPDSKTNEFHKQKVVVSPTDTIIVKQQIEDTLAKIKALEFKGCGDEKCDACQFELSYK